MSGNLWSTHSNQSGTKVAPNPTDKAAVRINLLRLVKGIDEMMRIPDATTAANRKVVIPPNTAEGMATRAAANLAKMPMMRSQKQAA
jgi:hypothetical protein